MFLSSLGAIEPRLTLDSSWPEYYCRAYHTFLYSLALTNLSLAHIQPINEYEDKNKRERIKDVHKYTKLLLKNHQLRQSTIDEPNLTSLRFFSHAIQVFEHTLNKRSAKSDVDVDLVVSLQPLL